MSKSDKSKIFASDALDELLDIQSKRSNTIWLMSYLDVFVLVVMLMVALVSISEIKPQPAPSLITSVIPAPEAPMPTSITPAPASLPTPTPIAQENALNHKIQQLDLQNAVQMTLNQGNAEFDIKEDVLFESSAAELTEAGKSMLIRLLPLLKETPGLITIEGHTDNRPVKSGKFLSNWDLSATRATSVLHFLATQQLDQSRLRTISYADTKPVADNQTEAGRLKNRRVNIIVQLEKSATIK